MFKSEATNRRKQYFIKKEFQFTFILKFCGILLAGIIISTVLLIVLSQGTLTSSFENSQLTIQNTATAILPSILLCNLITLGIITLVTIVLTLLVSHKLAGPMYRFQKEIETISSGNLTQKIKLRNKDEFESLAMSLDVMRISLHEKILRTQRDILKILNSTSRQGAPPEIVAQIEQLHHNIEGHFRI